MEPKPIPIATTAHGAPVVFSHEERERHVYIVGKSGSGKRTLLFNLALSDIVQGDSVVYSTGHPENLAK
jgi:ABC-type lipoprotein export system ATPase subunit